MRFTIPGDPVGYISKPYANRKSRRGGPWWLYSRSGIAVKIRRYIAYANETVLRCKNECGRLPVPGTKTAQVRIDVFPVFANGVHPDPENVRKGIVDALYYDRGGDKYVWGLTGFARYDPDNPRVEVFIDENANINIFDLESMQCPKH